MKLSSPVIANSRVEIYELTRGDQFDEYLLVVKKLHMISIPEYLKSYNYFALLFRLQNILMLSNIQHFLENTIHTQYNEERNHVKCPITCLKVAQ